MTESKKEAAKTPAEADKNPEATTPKEGEEKAEAKPKEVIPPLVAAARRLDKLLSAGVDTNQALDYFYTNPVKVVRRWLGTSSGASASADAIHIQAAAYTLLDETSSVAEGRRLLVEGYVPPPPPAVEPLSDTPMDTEESTTPALATVEAPKADSALVENTYVSRHSAAAVESWLLSLAVRLLWKQGKMPEAFELAERGIAIVMQHLTGSSSTLASSTTLSALYPLLARLYRWSALVKESMMNGASVIDVVAMAQAHNRATLRRDVDTQAALLNTMLRHLLRNSQGMLH
jgi:hypothetical protein